MDGTFGSRCWSGVFEGEGQAFVGFDPAHSCHLRHGLAGHPLFDLDALATACVALDPAAIEIRLPGKNHGEGFELAQGGPDAPDAIREVVSRGCWVALRGIEVLPGYAGPVGSVLDAMRGELAPWFDEMLAIETYVFISGQSRVTPLHFDPEFNILFQLLGEKRLTALPVEERFLPQLASETYHRDGNNILPWRDGYEEEGIAYPLRPGDAVYLPYKGPHWVQVGGGAPSVSLSVTWRTRASLDHDNACSLNGWLRRRGMAPKPARPLPARPRVKSLAFRALRRLKLA